MSTWRPAPVPRSERDPKPVSESLDRLTRRLGSPGSGVMSAVFSGWEDLVGADIAAHSRPVSLRDGVLLLEVDQPAWATQLRFMTADLLVRISEAAATADVAEIRIKVSGENPRQRGSKGRG